MALIKSDLEKELEAACKAVEVAHAQLRTAKDKVKQLETRYHIQILHAKLTDAKQVGADVYAFNPASLMGKMCVYDFDAKELALKEAEACYADLTKHFVIGQGTFTVKVRSEYTVTDDCGWRDVPWVVGDFDDAASRVNTNDKTFAEADLEELNLDLFTYPYEEGARFDDHPGDFEPVIDGDHHGVWARGTIAYPIMLIQRKLVG